MEPEVLLMKYDEVKILDEGKEYIGSTYKEHYIVRKNGKIQVQVLLTQL